MKVIRRKKEKVIQPNVSGIIYQRGTLYSGAVVSYYQGDEGWNAMNGVYRHSNHLIPKALARLDFSAPNPYFTLADLNAMGNFNRFTDELGGQGYLNNYAIDHLGGHGIDLILDVTRQWTNALDTIAAKNILGFTNFRMTNIIESSNMFNYSTISMLNYSPLSPLQNSNNTWTCTTSASNTLQAYHHNPINGLIGRVNKTNNARYIAIRNHYD